jgi:hypothetical protein
VKIRCRARCPNVFRGPEGRGGRSPVVGAIVGEFIQADRGLATRCSRQPRMLEHADGPSPPSWNPRRDRNGPLRGRRGGGGNYEPPAPAPWSAALGAPAAAHARCPRRPPTSRGIPCNPEGEGNPSRVPFKNAGRRAPHDVDGERHAGC